MTTEFASTVGRYWVEATALLSDGGYHGRADYSWRIDGYMFHGTKVFDQLFPTAAAACEDSLRRFDELYAAGDFPP